jgi:2-polyprenyl-3-methyl-5-hydroxy-6-metoxy-1,4-benzoquinol methylase
MAESSPGEPRRLGDDISIEGGYQHRARTRGFVIQRFWHAEKERVLRRFALPSPGERVLDVGCGSGVIADFLAAQGALTTGVDANPAAISYAREHFRRPNLEFRVGYVEDLDFEPASIDGIYRLEVIEHLYIPQARALLGRLRSLLKPGGRLVVTTPNYRGLWPLIEWILDRLKVAAPLAQHQHVSHFHRRMLAALLRDTGWTIQTLATFSTFAPFVSVAGWTLAERVARLEEAANFPFGNIILAVARREA